MTISLNRLDQFEQGAIDVSFVGSRIKAIRESHKYSVEDLAVTCGLANQEIADIEDGNDADPVRLRRIAAALRVTIEDLFDNA